MNCKKYIFSVVVILLSVAGNGFAIGDDQSNDLFEGPRGVINYGTDLPAKDALSLSPASSSLVKDSLDFLGGGAPTHTVANALSTPGSGENHMHVTAFMGTSAVPAEGPKPHLSHSIETDEISNPSTETHAISSLEKPSSLSPSYELPKSDEDSKSVDSSLSISQEDKLPKEVSPSAKLPESNNITVSLQIKIPPNSAGQKPTVQTL